MPITVLFFLQSGSAIEGYHLLYDVATHIPPFSVVTIVQDCTLHRSRTIQSVVAVDRLTNAVAMSSAGFSLDLAQFKLGIDRKLVYCVKEVV